MDLWVPSCQDHIPNARCNDMYASLSTSAQRWPIECTCLSALLASTSIRLQSFIIKGCASDRVAHLIEHSVAEPL
eukprot:5628-Eustigmatos_ZCMA.PRE.1